MSGDRAAPRPPAQPPPMAAPAPPSAGRLPPRLATYAVPPPSQRGPAPPADTPVQVAFFSKARGVAAVPGDASGLGPVSPPPLPADLDAGYPDGHVYDGWHASVGEVVAAVVAVDPSLIASADVVTYRNNLNKIYGTSIEGHGGGGPKGWLVDGMALGGEGGENATTTASTVFLDIVYTPCDDFPGADKFMYWGSKFEALCSRDRAAAARTGRSEFCAVVDRPLAGMRVLMGAEVDGYDVEKAKAEAGTAPSSPAERRAAGIPPSAYVELKTLAWPHPGREWSLFSWKTPKWWLQSWLGGVRSLLLGGRDARGALVRTDSVPVDDIPAWSARDGRARWTAGGIVGVGDGVLSWMVATARERPGVALRFEFVPNGGRTPPGRPLGTVTAREVVEEGGDGGGLEARVRTALERA